MALRGGTSPRHSSRPTRARIGRDALRRIGELSQTHWGTSPIRYRARTCCSTRATCGGACASADDEEQPSRLGPGPRRAGDGTCPRHSWETVDARPRAAVRRDAASRARIPAPKRPAGGAPSEQALTTLMTIIPIAQLPRARRWRPPAGRISHGPPAGCSTWSSSCSWAAETPPARVDLRLGR